MKGRQNERRILSYAIGITDTGPDGCSGGYPSDVTTTFETDSFVRSYPPTRNPPLSQKVKPPPPQKVPRVIYVPSDPPIYRRVRFKIGGRWFSRKKLIKVPKVILVFPKRKTKKRSSGKPKSKPRRVFRQPNEHSFWKWKITSQKDADWSAEKHTPAGTYRRTLSGNMCLQPVPFGPFYGSGDHRPDFMSEIAAQQSKAYYKLYDKVVGGFYDDLKDQSINFAQALAESRQVTSMIVDFASRAASALRNLKRGNFGKLKSSFDYLTSKQLANDWLVYQYGVKPLLSDIDGMAKHLAKSIHGIPPVKAKKSSKVSLDYDETFGFSAGASGTARLSIKTDAFMKIGCDVLFDIPMLSQPKQLGFLNVPALAWELVPYSFVADWFFPIGDFLNRLDATADLKPQSIYFTFFTKQVVRLTLTPHGEDANGYEWTGSDCGLEFEVVNMVRYIPTNLPPIPNPTFKNPFSLGHIANALALFRQLKH